MPVITMPFGPLEANCHIVYQGSDAVIFDPSSETEQVLDTLAAHKLTLHAIALTHLHADHCLGCAALARITGLTPFVGKEDWDERSLLLCKGMSFGMYVEPFEARILEPGEVVWGALRCRVIGTPGHSAGSLCYYFPDLKAVITGDLLFYRSVGRTDFPGGDSEALARSLRGSIYTLPGDVTVYPGHGPETSVGAEASGNLYCRA
ncbi:MBL fold metallo-hydrolase [uncultured Mailhella sp.]|uniref:MBL fold metallo-hydrolase n=1 Tax=uncultured Mailhella sp. TaxID=1981031 RepID=UPI00260E20DD|nr:MBL fold metallo-hydrolase [uncultured Mailhella sp.]